MPALQLTEEEARALCFLLRERNFVCESFLASVRRKVEALASDKARCDASTAKPGDLLWHPKLAKQCTLIRYDGISQLLVEFISKENKPVSVWIEVKEIDWAVSDPKLVAAKDSEARFQEAVAEERLCRCGKDGVELHTCPFAEEIYGDCDNLCNCCDDCTQTCCDDI